MSFMEKEKRIRLGSRDFSVKAENARLVPCNYCTFITGPADDQTN